MSVKKSLCLLIVLLMAFSCATTKPKRAHTIRYGTFARPINFPEPTAEQKNKFHAEAKADVVTIEKDNGTKMSGCVTSNKEFLDEIIVPIIEKNRQKLEAMHAVELINTLALFGDEIYKTYFGESPFVWGGDILDLDDPREKGIRYDYRYGFDCSGFGAMPFEAAVYCGLMKPDDPAAVFSSKGFEIFCKENGVQDKGGRDGGSNRFRLDSNDMLQLGREIAYIPKDGSPSQEDLEKMQAGDMVVGLGHIGIIVEIQGKLYYLEAGGYVVPPSGGNPYFLGEGLTIFATRCPLSIRRSLPDYGKIEKGGKI